MYKQVTKLCGNHQRRKAAEVGRRQGWEVRNRKYADKDNKGKAEKSEIDNTKTKTTKTMLKERLGKKSLTRVPPAHRVGRIKDKCVTSAAFWSHLFTHLAASGGGFVNQQCSQCYQDSCCCGTWSVIWLECQRTPSSPSQPSGSWCSWSCCCYHQGPLKPLARRATEIETFSPFFAINLQYWGGQCDYSASVKWAKNHYDIMSQISGRFDQWANQVICVGRSLISLKNWTSVEPAN